MSDAPMKRCTRGDECIHPDGPWLPATTEYFHKHTKAGGLNPKCKLCLNQYVRERRAKNPDAVRTYYRERKQRLRQDPTWREHDNAYAREYRRRRYAEDQEYAEKLRARGRKRKGNPSHLERTRMRYYERMENDPGYQSQRKNYLRNRYATDPGYRENRLENARKWKRRNPDKVNRWTRVRRSRIRSLSRSLSYVPYQEEAALSYWKGRCAVCGQQPDDTRILALDHWIAVNDPRPDNPGTVSWNLVPLCHGVGGCNNSKQDKDAAQWLTERYGEHRAREILARIEAYFEYVRSVKDGGE